MTGAKAKRIGRAVDALTEDELDAAARSDPDNLPLDEEFLKHAKIITPPPKKDIHMRVDEDVLAWFKKQGRGYQARVNAVLRAYVQAQSGLPDQDQPS